MVINEDSRRISRVLNGDSNAYAEIVDAYKIQIFNLAYRLTGNRVDAEDLAQETFIKAYEGLNSFNVQKPFFPWLYTIALNLIRNHLSKKRPLAFDNIERISAKQYSSADNTPESQLVEYQKAELVFQAVQKLPFTLREAVVLRYYQELPFKDIAGLLNLSISATKMRVYRALDVLKRLMPER